MRLPFYLQVEVRLAVLRGLLAVLFLCHSGNAQARQEELSPSADNRLSAAIRAGDEQEFREQLAVPQNLSQADAETGWTALHWAVERNRSDFVEQLLTAGAEVNCRDKLGKTPLHLASRRGWSEMLEMLIDRGAKVDTEDDQGATPLFDAVLFNQVSAVKVLLKHRADPERKTSAGLSPQGLARKLGKQEVLALFGLDEEPLEAGQASRKVPELPAVDTRMFLDRLAAEVKVEESAPALPVAPMHPTESKQPVVEANPNPGGAEGVSPPPRKFAPPAREEWQAIAERRRVMKVDAVQNPANWLGFELMSPTGEVLQMRKIRGAAAVIKVRENGAAWRAGIEPGDMIIGVSNRPITSPEEALRRISKAIQAGEAAIDCQMDRAAEGINFTATVRLPQFGAAYQPVSADWTLEIPDGWIRIEEARHVTPDPEFDTLSSPNGESMLIISRNGFPVADRESALESYRLQKVEESKGYLEPGVERLEISGLAAFRVFYRSKQTPTTAISRMAFVYGQRRYVLNTVQEQAIDQQLPPEVEQALGTLKLLPAKGR